MANPDSRPYIAVGHVRLRAVGVRAAASRLEAIGVRPIVVRDSLAVMELRGGTHIVMRELEGDAEAEHQAAWDFMVDDIEHAHQLLAGAGFDVTEIERGTIHDSFVATAPEKFRVEVTSSHAGDRIV